MLFFILNESQGQINISEKLENGHFPVVFNVSVTDPTGTPANAEVWAESLESGEKISFEKVSDGKYIQLFKNEKAQLYYLLAKFQNVTSEKQTISVTGTSEIQKIINKTIVLPSGNSMSAKNKQPVLLKINIYDDEQQLVDGQITIVDLNDKKIEGVKKISQGKYELSFSNDKAHEYNISISENDFLYENIMVYIPAMTSESQTVEEDFHVKVTSQPVADNNTGKQTTEPILTSSRVGEKIRLRHVFFENGLATLKSESFEELDNLYEALKNTPTMKIEISGHTDNVGNPASNKLLSQRRAETVLNYLVKKGISPNRLKAVGYGEERPIASNDDEKDGRELNRRTEVVILEK